MTGRMIEIAETGSGKSHRDENFPVASILAPHRRAPVMCFYNFVRAADDIPRHFHDIGIRIEDDALVTESGCEILTGKVPKAAGEIEALMRN